MALWHAQTTIGTVSNISADYATNNTYWVGSDESIFPTLVSEIKASYDLWRPSMSGLVRQTLHTTKIYSMTDPVPRAPIHEQSWALAVAPAGSALPPEVSLCCSFQGDRQSGIPQARRRGRNYLPFLQATMAGADARPTVSAINNAIAWGQNLLDFSQATPSCVWVVNSTIGDPLENTVLITNGWVDNEFDTQRRRGRDATSRTLFT